MAVVGYILRQTDPWRETVCRWVTGHCCQRCRPSAPHRPHRAPPAGSPHLAAVASECPGRGSGQVSRKDPGDNAGCSHTSTLSWRNIHSRTAEGSRENCSHLRRAVCRACTQSTNISARLTVIKRGARTPERVRDDRQS